MSHPCERVLVVNDEPDLIAALVEALRAEGAHVEWALGALAALQVIDGGLVPSVILTAKPFTLETLYATIASVC